MDAQPYTGPGADRDARPRGAHHRGQRRLSRGLVPAGRQRTSRPATPPAAASTSSSSRSSRRAGARRGSPARAVFQYPNDQRPATLWYHDHALGMTRLNVYAGPAGFYLVRSSGDDVAARLPKPAPQPRRQARDEVPRDPDRHPGSLLQRRRLAVLPRQPRLLRGLNVPGESPAVPRRAGAAHPAHAGRSPGRPDERHLAAVEPRVLRQHHGRQRQDVAVPERRAAALSLPPAERHPVPVPHAHDEQRHALHADRQRGRLPARAGQAAGSC